jgi:hypothetical protein
MSFGNTGGGHRTGPKYREQTTVGLTPEQFAYLRRRDTVSLADALRQCVVECMEKDSKC